MIGESEELFDSLGEMWNTLHLFSWRMVARWIDSFALLPPKKEDNPWSLLTKVKMLFCCILVSLGHSNHKCIISTSVDRITHGGGRIQCIYGSWSSIISAQYSQCSQILVAGHRQEPWCLVSVQKCLRGWCVIPSLIRYSTLGCTFFSSRCIFLLAHLHLK